LEIAGVVAHPQPTALWGETLDQVAQSAGLPLFQPARVNAPDFLDRVQSLKVDLGILAGYSQIVRQDLIGIPALGIINLHGGLVPAYRGSSITRWVLLNDEKAAGVSILQVEEGIDTGPILAEGGFSLKDDDRSLEVIKKQLAVFPDLLVQVVRGLAAGNLQGVPQVREAGNYWHTLKPEDGRVRFESMTARQVFNWVRAFDHPYAGAFAFHQGKKCTIRLAEELTESFRGVPGRVCGVRDGGVVVLAADRGILIKKVQMEGGGETWARETIRVGSQFDR
jgi:methionyl-tRNA formyltransferase